MMNEFKRIIVDEINEIVTVTSPKGRQETITCRKTYGISFCKSGQITYTHKGRKYISDRDCAIILPKNESYILHGDKDGVFDVVNFECRDFLCDEFKIIPIESTDIYLKEFEQMKTLSFFEDNSFKIMSVFYNILHRLFETPKSTLLSPAIKFIEENYSQPTLDNSSLAAKCGISEVYFRKLFKEEFKTSPKQFIIDLRLNHAKQLLSEGKLKISAIARDCGFSNTYHFCRSFKQKFTITPTEYMLKNRIYKI